MRMEKNKIIDTIWTVIIAGIIILLLVTMTVEAGNICLEKLDEQKDYYINFLWPKIYSYVNIYFIIPFFLCGYYYSESLIDKDTKVKEKERLVIKNVALGSIGVLGGAYALVSTLWLRVLNLAVVIIGVAAVAAIVALALNSRRLKRLDEDATIDEIWDGASVRFNVLLALVVVCSLLFFNVMSKSVCEARKEYKNVSCDKVELGFGHIQGFEDNRATVKVEFVNMYGSSGRQYTLEELEKEYTNFKTGQGSWSNLWSFCEESINIELKSQGDIVGISNKIIYDDSNRYLEQYYFPEENYEDKVLMYKDRDDKLDDIIYFTVCVEEELNLQGLTLRQLNDSADLDADLPKFLELEYESATPEQVVEACHSFGAKKEPVGGNKPSEEKESAENNESEDLQVDSICLNMTVSPGQKISDVELTEEHGYPIDRVEWTGYKNIEGYGTLDGEDRLEDGDSYLGDYTLHVYMKFPLSYDLNESLKLQLSGINYNELRIDKSYKGEINEIKIDIWFDMRQQENLTYTGLEIGLIDVGTSMPLTEYSLTDECKTCEAEYVGWMIYHIETGTATDYEEANISENNLCYIAVIKIIPKEEASFDDVEIVYDERGTGNTFIYPYEASLHDYKAGEYPVAYYEKLEEDGQQYIMAYVPYFSGHTIGENGELINQHNGSNYVYLPQGAALGTIDTPNPGYELDRYVVTDIDGNVLQEANKYTMGTFYMPGEPIVITGYFEQAQ